MHGIAIIWVRENMRSCQGATSGSQGNGFDFQTAPNTATGKVDINIIRGNPWPSGSYRARITSAHCRDYQELEIGKLPKKTDEGEGNMMQR
jgi:hypothetical protein